MISLKMLRNCLRLKPDSSLVLLLLLCVGCSSGGTSGGGSGGGTPPAPNTKQWTWVNGSNQAGSSSSLNGSFGTEGVASTTNVPAGRSQSLSWADNSGNLWLFGSANVDPLGTSGSSNDLWQYNLATKEWTWVSGSGTGTGRRTGVYGTEGIAAATNVPGGRDGAVSWTDAGGNLWLFGGSGADSTGQIYLLNDLWEFSPSTKQWAWISGSNTVLGKAVYGTLGVAAAANVPGARQWGASWKDSNGNFWLFGGQGLDVNNATGSFNDLWEFNPSSKQWTWVSGGKTVNVSGVYGSVGTASSTNMPGSRSNSISWTDHNGNLWLFGGLGYDSTIFQSDLNDLWEFNISSKQWTWVSGLSAIGGGGPLCSAGVYGTQGTAAAANVPGGRNSAVSWTDAAGNLWLFGGLGCDASGTPGSLNDLWEFNTASKTWTWQSGSNSVGPAQGGTGGPSGIYGTLGTAAAGNVPGGRSGSVSWVDSSGTFWLFGGLAHDSTGAFGSLNDLWSYTP